MTPGRGVEACQEVPQLTLSADKRGPPATTWSQTGHRDGVGRKPLIVCRKSRAVLPRIVDATLVIDQVG